MRHHCSWQRSQPAIAQKLAALVVLLSCSAATKQGGAAGHGVGAEQMESGNAGASAALLSVAPREASNTGGVLLTVSGTGFTASGNPRSKHAVCKFFYNAAGNAWGVEGSQFPGRSVNSTRLIPMPDPVSAATILNDTHLQCLSPELRVPLGTGPTGCGGSVEASCGWARTALISGPVSLDISVDGSTFTGRTALDPPLLYLYSLFSASPGRRTYAAGHGPHLLLLDIHPSLAAAGQLAVRMACAPPSSLHLPARPAPQPCLSVRLLHS